MNEQSPDARYAPPQSHVEDVHQTDQGLPGQLASRGKRFLAVVIDMLAGFGVLGLLAVFTPFNIWARKDPGFWHLHVDTAVIGFAIFLVLQGYLLCSRGQTIGKRVFKLRIARPDGSRASIARILGLRYALPSVLGVVPAVSAIYGLVDALFIFRASRRCLHDQIADTVVLQA